MYFTLCLIVFLAFHQNSNGLDIGEILQPVIDVITINDTIQLDLESVIDIITGDIADQEFDTSK